MKCVREGNDNVPRWSDREAHKDDIIALVTDRVLIYIWRRGVKLYRSQVWKNHSTCDGENLTEIGKIRII
jgi:hypothetical protein